MCSKSKTRFMVALACTFISVSLLSAEDWPKFRRDLGNTGASAENFLSSSNIDNLSVRWVVRLSFDGAGTSPVIATINRRQLVFIGTSSSFQAFDANTGLQVWQFDLDSAYCKTYGIQYPGTCYVASTAAIADGFVYFGGSDAVLYALDASTGAKAWEWSDSTLGDPFSGATIWTSPSVFRGLVYFGISSHDDDPCVVGQVLAAHALTGKLAWHFPTLMQATCPGCLGGGVWASPAVDTTQDPPIVYVGTGNICSPPPPNATGFWNSILALNGETGQLINYYQSAMLKDDHADHDFGSSPVLYTTTNERGLKQRWLSEASKNGYLYTARIGSSGLESVSKLLLNNSPEVNLDIIASSAAKEVSTKEGTDVQIYNATGVGHVSRFDVPTMKVSWDLPVVPDCIANSDASPCIIDSSPTLIDNLVLFGALDGTVRGLTKEGVPVYTLPAQSGYQVYSEVAISDGRVYVVLIPNRTVLDPPYSSFMYCLTVDKNKK